MKKLQQNGFSAVEVLVVILVILVIGGAGLLFYRHRQAKPSTQSTQPAPTVSAPKSTTTTKPTNPNDGYMVITEWGVRIKQDPSVGELYYTMDTTSPQLPTATIYSKTADAIVGPGGVACKGEYVAYLNRYKVGDSSQNEPTADIYIKVKTINGYDYIYTTKKQYGPNCFYASKDATTADQATADKFNAVVTAFRNDINTLSAAQ